MKSLVVEHTAPFQALPELVADAEGLFAREGIRIEWVNTNEGADRDARTDVMSPKGLDPYRSHGRLLEQGKADMYNACEWGNYCRVQDTGVRQPPGRPAQRWSPSQRSSYARIRRCTRRNSSPTARSACRSISAPTISRLHMLEGFLTREDDQGVQRAARLALSLRPADAGRHRRDHADRTLRHTGREEGLPHRSALRSITAPRSRTDAIDAETYERVQPRRAPRQCSASDADKRKLPAVLHRLS